MYYKDFVEVQNLYVHPEVLLIIPKLSRMPLFPLCF